MRSNLGTVLSSFGVVFLALALTSTIIELLGARFDTPHHTAVMLALGAFGIGAVLFGAGFMMKRRA